jgi:hypothetical protein
MGEEADFFSVEGIADPVVVRALKTIEPLPDDPLLLARLIEHYAGDDLRNGHVGLNAGIIKIRVELKALLGRIQHLSQGIQKLDTERNVESTELAIISLIPHDLRKSNPRLASRAVDAIDLLATLPLTKGKKPETDPVQTDVVRAVRAYCERTGIPFTGEPRVPSAAEKTKVEVRSQAATLARDVLRALGLEVTPKRLGTLFRKVRES